MNEDEILNKKFLINFGSDHVYYHLFIDLLIYLFVNMKN